MIKKLSLITICLLFLQGLYAQKFVVPEIPDNIEKKDYANYRQDALSGIDWLKTHSPNDKQRQEVSAFVLWWLEGTTDVNLVLKADVMKFDNVDLFMLFLGGWAEYAIQNKDDDQTNGCVAGVETAISYYEKYKSQLTKDKGTEDFIKMKKKGTLKSYIAKAMK